MEYTKEFDVRTFEFWSGGQDTFEDVKERKLLDELQSHLEEVFEGTTPSTTEINDYMWFGRDEIYKALGMNDDYDDDDDEEY